MLVATACPGLGTSSILGGAILAGLWRAVGQEHSQDSLIHAVSCGKWRVDTRQCHSTVCSNRCWYAVTSGDAMLVTDAQTDMQSQLKERTF